MFWRFMTGVHGLPPFEKKDEQPWWTEEEQAILDLVQYQLSYVRPFEKDVEHKFPVYDSGSKYGDCFGADVVKENGEWTLGCTEGYAKFFEEHTDLGRYLRSVTFSGYEEPIYICPDCMAKETSLDTSWDGDDQDELEELYTEQRKLGEERKYVWDVDGPGKVLDLSKDDVGDEYRFTCPVCGGNAREAMYDEGPDVEVVMVFEKGSIAFAHYGRGAGLSVRLHKNLPGWLEWSEDQDPVSYFEELDYEGSGW